MNNSAIVTFNGINAQLKLCPNTGFVRQVYYNEKNSPLIVSNLQPEQYPRKLQKSTSKYDQIGPEKIRPEKLQHPLETTKVSRLGYYLGYLESTSYLPRIQNGFYADKNGQDKIKLFNFNTLPPGDKLLASKIKIVHGMRKCGINFADYFKNNETPTANNAVV